MANEETERIRIHDVVLKTGLSKRTIQKMAQRGRIPGAAKLGTVWTFNRKKLASWIADAERRWGNPHVRHEEAWSPWVNPLVQKIRDRGRYGRTASKDYTGKGGPK